jgi:hypothetical protein
MQAYCFTEDLKNGVDSSEIQSKHGTRARQAVDMLQEPAIKNRAIQTWKTIFEELSHLQELIDLFSCLCKRSSTFFRATQPLLPSPIPETAADLERIFLALELNDSVDVPPQLPKPIFGEEIRTPTLEKPVIAVETAPRPFPELTSTFSPKQPWIGQISSLITALSGELRPLTSQETVDHLFLAAQSLELFFECLRTGRHNVLFPCLQAHLIDCHVAVESSFSASTHSLCKAASTEEPFLREYDQSLLWMRYPETYKKRYPTLPLPLQWLSQLTDQHSPPPLHTIARHLTTNFTAMVSFLSRRAPSAAAFTDPFNRALLSSVERLSLVPSVSTTPSKPVYPSISQTIRKCHHLAHIETGNPTLPLQEAAHYIQLITCSQELAKLYPQPALYFWHSRNLLNIDKVFKHLSETCCLIHGIGFVGRHSLAVYRERLQDTAPIPQEIMTALEPINVGITHHYHTRPSPLFQERQLLLQHALSQVGFATQAPDVSHAGPIFKNICALVDRALTLLPSYLASILAECDQLNQTLKSQKQNPSSETKV